MQRPPLNHCRVCGTAVVYRLPDDGDTKERAKAYADAAKNGYLVGAAHIAFPGLGHVRKGAGKAYIWVPVNSSSLKSR